jgi:GxxExxY protein
MANDEPPMTPISTMRPDHDPRTYAIIGAAQLVHRELGSGYLERPYEEALAIELAERGIPFERQVELGIIYRGRLLDAKYRADLLVAGEVLVELKATTGLGPVDEAQLLHYLKASGISTGLLLNFGTASLQQRRMVWGPKANRWASAESVVGPPVGATAARVVPAPPPIPTSGTTPAP